MSAAMAEGRRRILLTLPTGSGKTNVLCWFIAEHVGAGTALVLAHREELIRQIEERVRLLLPKATVSVEKAESSAYWGSDVVIACLPTLARGRAARAKRLAERFDLSLVVYDEVHHATAAGNRAVLKALGCFDADGPTLLGCTATPHRLDRQSLAHLFECEAYRLGLREMIDDGWLCPIVGRRVETSVDLSGVKTTAGDFAPGELAAAVNCRERSLVALEYWQQVAKGRPTLAFCVDVAHAEDTATLFNERGVRAAVISGRTQPEERPELLRRFTAGEIEVLCNCQILTEGVDLPCVSCILMLRPTKSEALYSQMLGRGVRLFPGKDHLLVIDLVDNGARNRLVTAPVLFGLPAELDCEQQPFHQVKAKVEGAGVPANRLEGLRSLAELSHRMEEWDLFQGELPREVAKLTQRLWTCWKDGYRLNLRDGCLAAIEPEGSGHWEASLWAGGRCLGKRTVLDLAEAFRVADRAVTRQWGEDADWTRRDAKWVTEPASAKQRAFLSRMGVDRKTVAGLTRGQASRAISRLLEKNGKPPSPPA
jgi:superfamily II DNA or RNA helicase